MTFDLEPVSESPDEIECVSVLGCIFSPRQTVGSLYLDKLVLKSVYMHNFNIFQTSNTHHHGEYFDSQTPWSLQLDCMVGTILDCPGKSEGQSDGAHGTEGFI